VCSKLNKSIAELLASLKVPVLPDEVKGHQFLGRHAFLGVLLEDGVDKVLELLRNLPVGGEFDLVSDLNRGSCTILTRSSCSLMLKGEVPRWSS
jgi:hypothetical protein